MSSFMGPGKPSSLITTFMNASLLWGGLVEGEWCSSGWHPGGTITGSQNFILRVGARFQHSRDFVEDCRTWHLRAHAYDILVRFFPCRVYTDSNHCDTLRYEWSLAHWCHLVVCLDVLDGWFRGLWLGLSWLYFNNNVNYLGYSCLLHVIVYRCKPNIWLN
jgi:hypothetical protein